jgi:hypothetical protein
VYKRQVIGRPSRHIQKRREHVQPERPRDAGGVGIHLYAIHSAHAAAEVVCDAPVPTSEV